MVNWTPELVAKFLVVTLQQITPHVSRETWNKVAEVMGDDITAEACRQKYAKLLSAAGIETATPVARRVPPSTPRLTPNTPGSRNRKRKDLDSNDQTPSKSASAKKARKSLSTTNPKNEDPEIEEENLIVPRTPPFGKLGGADDSD